MPSLEAASRRTARPSPSTEPVNTGWVVAV